jgi:hypothetical protein
MSESPKFGDAKSESRDVEELFFWRRLSNLGGRSLAVPTSNPVIYMGIYPDRRGRIF